MLGMKHDKDATEERMKVADDMMTQTTSILTAFSKLQEEVGRLQRLKNQYQIYLQFYNNDRLQLQDIYQNLKRSLSDLVKLKNEEITETPEKSDGKPLPYALFLTSISWEIDIHNPFFSKEHIRLRYVLNANSIICTISFNLSGTQFAFADGRTIFLANSRDGSLLQTFQLPQTLEQKEMQTRAVKFSPDSQYVAANGSDNLIYIFNIDSGDTYAILDGHTDVVSSFVFTSDSSKLISGGFDGKIIIWDLQTKKITKEINHRDAESDRRSKDAIIVDIAFGFNDEFIVVGFMNGRIGIYEPTFSQNMSAFAAHQMPLLGLSSSRKSELICTASQDNTLKIWSLRGIASCKQTLISHTNYVVTSTFSHDDRFLFSGSKDESLKIWNISSGDLECSINAHQNTIFRIDHHPTENSFMTCGGDGYICYWEYDLP